MSANHPQASHAFLSQKASDADCDVIFSAPQLLLVDLDGADKQLNARVLDYIKERWGIQDIKLWPSRSGEGCHVMIVLSKELPLWARIALQCALGSDPMRETLGVAENLEGIDNVCLFRPWMD